MSPSIFFSQFLLRIGFVCGCRIGFSLQKFKKVSVLLIDEIKRINEETIFQSRLFIMFTGILKFKFLTAFCNLNFLTVVKNLNF